MQLSQMKRGESIRRTYRQYQSIGWTIRPEFVHPYCHWGAANSPFGEDFTMHGIGEPIRFAGSTLKDRAHICAFFNSAEEARRVLLPFISEGLEVGDKVLHTIDPQKREEHIH